MTEEEETGAEGQSQGVVKKKSWSLGMSNKKDKQGREGLNNYRTRGHGRKEG